MNLISISEAAERLGVSEATARRMCQESRLKAQKVGRAWIVDWDAQICDECEGDGVVYVAEECHDCGGLGWFE